MHPLLVETEVEGLVHVRDVRSTSLEYARSLGEVFHARSEDDPIVTMKIEGDDPAAIPYASCRSAALSLHTDYATFSTPPRFTITHCIEPDPEFPKKGLSIVIRTAPVVEHLRNKEPELYALLKSACFPFRRNAEHDRYHADVPLHPILDDGDQVRFDRTLILPSLENSSDDGRSTLIDAVFAFEDLCLRHGERFELALDTGDILIIDNRRVIHSRGECTVHHENGRIRSREVNLVFLR
jgi:alpha-ketoglutarate-dependent taurine dioxygenase